MWSNILMWIHVIITTVFLLLIPVVFYQDGNILFGTARKYYEVDSSFHYRTIIFIAVALLLIAQVIFIFNFFAGTFTLQNK